MQNQDHWIDIKERPKIYQGTTFMEKVELGMDLPSWTCQCLKNVVHRIVLHNRQVFILERNVRQTPTCLLSQSINVWRFQLEQNIYLSSTLTKGMSESLYLPSPLRFCDLKFTLLQLFLSFCALLISSMIIRFPLVRGMSVWAGRPCCFRKYLKRSASPAETSWCRPWHSWFSGCTSS